MIHERPVFKFSKHLVYYSVLFPFLLVTSLVLAAAAGPSDQAALSLAGLLFVGSLGGAIGSVGIFFTQVRDARFYESRFDVKGWKVNRVIDYTDIQAVVKNSRQASWGGDLEIRILLKGENHPVTIPGIPKSRSLKTDLYSWLSAKVTGLQREGLPKDSPKAELHSSDDMLCVVSSPNLTLNRQSCAVLVTKTFIVTSSEASSAMTICFGPDSQAAEKETAFELAQDVLRTSDRQLSKEAVAEVGYQPPGTVNVGHLIIRTVEGDLRLTLGPLSSDTNFKQMLTCLLTAFIEFSPGIVRSEKSGELLTTVKL